MRSLLFVPADSERKLARGLESGADALILDLEDSVAAANREVARRQAREFLEAHGAERRSRGSDPVPLDRRRAARRHLRRNQRLRLRGQTEGQAALKGIRRTWFA